MRSKRFAAGDWVLYRKLKYSRLPGPRAQSVEPAPNGDGYSYFVDKYWTVEEVLGDGRLKLRTRTGKTHWIGANDPNLQRITWWNRWRYKRQFRDS